MSERRGSPTPDTGRRRRRDDPVDIWALRRDQILVGVGLTIVLVISLASLFVEIKTREVALAGLTVGAGLCGAPLFLRLDEARQRRVENGGA